MNKLSWILFVALMFFAVTYCYTIINAVVNLVASL